MPDRRKPTREDQDRWEGTPSRARPPREPDGALLMDGPVACSRPVPLSTSRLIVRSGGAAHRYVRTGPDTFEYVGSVG